MSFAPSELLLRHPQLLDTSTLVLGCFADADGHWFEQIKQSGCQVQTWDWATAQACQRAGLESVTRFGAPAVPEAGIQRVVLFWPKAKVQALALLDLLKRHPVECYAVAANDAGGKSIGSAIKGQVSQCEKLDVARRCSLWSFQPEADSSAFNWLRYARSFEHEGLDFLTLAGVFNHGKLDQGTALLLSVLDVPAQEQGRVLDLGCGSGVIGLSVKLANPELDIVMADVDAMALQSARLNSARLGLPAEIVPSDVLAQIDGRFDMIVSNPPFHTGKDTDYHFARQLLGQAKQHLKRHGSLWIVANNHLPYEDWGKEYFAEATQLTSGRGFKVIRFC